jgi:hypothetical protein
MYYLKECFNFNFVTETQARVIEALSSTWKVLLMDRLYNIVEWKVRTPIENRHQEKEQF